MTKTAFTTVFLNGDTDLPIEVKRVTGRRNGFAIVEMDADQLATFDGMLTILGDVPVGETLTPDENGIYTLDGFIFTEADLA